MTDIATDFQFMIREIMGLCHKHTTAIVEFDMPIIDFDDEDQLRGEIGDKIQTFFHDLAGKLQ